MRMFYSPKGIPVIEFNENFRLLFGISSAINQKIKWATISGNIETTIKLKRGKTVTEKTETQGFSTIVDLKFRKMPKEIKECLPKGFKRVKNIIEDLLDEDETLHISKLKDLEEELK